MIFAVRRPGRIGEQPQLFNDAPTGAARAAIVVSNNAINWRLSIMNAIERIKSQLSAAPVVLYMKGTPDFPQCGFSAQTVSALRACKAQFAHVNIFEDPEVREQLKVYSNWPTFPQLYINGELVGGCDITLQMYKSGELRQILAEAGAVPA
jgi:monothiol glutaredoxin